MREVGSLNHSRWECKYHIVFIPKYRRKILFGQIRKDLAEVFHRLARQKRKCDRRGPYNGVSRKYDDINPSEICSVADCWVY